MEPTSGPLPIALAEPDLGRSLMANPEITEPTKDGTADLK
jgi:hypothetical protein